MFLYPFFSCKGSWKCVHDIWHNWQSLNVGMLAFISSLVALNISRVNANKQRERNFIAAKAFLPEELSELTTYFKSSSSLLLAAFELVETNSERRTRGSTPFDMDKPNLPSSYKEVFSTCIKFAEPIIGDHLAKILMNLQIHNSRLNSLHDSLTGASNEVVIKQNIMSYMYSLGTLQALVNRTFNFARSLEKFDSSSLDWSDYKTAYFNLNIEPEDIDDLTGFTQRAIARENSNNSANP